MKIFFEEWIDSRLAHNFSGKLLVKDRNIFKLMWHPDVYFANARQANFQEVTEDNFLVWIDPKGRIFYDCRSVLIDLSIALFFFFR